MSEFITSAELRVEAERLVDENESLRERFDRFEYKMGCLLCDLTGGLISKAETTDNNAIAEVVHERFTQELEADNAELRELVRHMLTCAANVDFDGSQACQVCPYDRDGDRSACDFGRRAQELGIEVD